MPHQSASIAHVLESREDPVLKIDWEHSRLVVAHKHSWPRLQGLLAAAPPAFLPAASFVDPEGDTCGQPHAPLERPSHRPLAQPAVPNCPQEQAGEDSIACTEGQQQERGDAERDKGSLLSQAPRQDERDGAEQHDERDGGGGEIEEPAHAGVGRRFWTGCRGVGMRLAGWIGSSSALG